MRPLTAITIAGFMALSACSRTVGPPVLPTAALSDVVPFGKVAPAGFRVLYNFNNAGGGGINPYAGLIDLNGPLYGTTHSGGSSSACPGGCGTVFSLSMSGNEKQLYSFGSYDDDGLYPAAELIDLNGTLYGTTRKGGSSSACAMGCGTVFSVSQTGKERVLYSFGSYKGDGTSPHSSLIDVGGTLFGTTEAGGAKNSGTVFSISRTGEERVIYSFGSHAHDGLYPGAGLTNLHGTFFGTTQRGGAQNAGTVFKVSRNGTERVLHSFGHSIDGQYPEARLTFARGAFYGTTTAGGKYNGGTVFIVSTTGIEGVLHSFGKGSDGRDPQAALTREPGPFVAFYGTTARGGGHALGTIFSVSAAGVESVLHSFDGTDGAYPHSRVIRFGGSIFGTTPFGGSGSCSSSHGSGCGAAFMFTP